LISAPWGDCGNSLRLEVAGRQLTRSEGVIHFAVAASNWWANIGYT
jgi:hypothetical protein